MLLLRGDKPPNCQKSSEWEDASKVSTTRRICWKKDSAAPCATGKHMGHWGSLGGLPLGRASWLALCLLAHPAVGAFLGGSDITRLPRGSMPTWVRSRKAMAVREPSRLWLGAPLGGRTWQDGPWGETGTAHHKVWVFTQPSPPGQDLFPLFVISAAPGPISVVVWPHYVIVTCNYLLLCHPLAFAPQGLALSLLHLSISRSLFSLSPFSAQMSSPLGISLWFLRYQSVLSLCSKYPCASLWLSLFHTLQPLESQFQEEKTCRLVGCVYLLFLFNCALEIQFTCYKVHLFKVYSSVGFFSILTQVCSPHRNLTLEHFCHPEKKESSHFPQFPSSATAVSNCWSTWCFYRFAYPEHFI